MAQSPVKKIITKTRKLQAIKILFASKSVAHHKKLCVEKRDMTLEKNPPKDSTYVKNVIKISHKI